MSNIVQTLTPTTHDLGQFQVRRVLPSRARSMVGPFIFVDQFGPRSSTWDREWTCARTRISTSPR